MSGRPGIPRLATISGIAGPAVRPAYDPSLHGVGMVHIGIGAFHRAHQAVATDDALAAKGGDWRIVGVSLRSRETAEAINAQNGLYTLIERGTAGSKSRVIGALSHVIAADPAATLAALCDPAIRIVTLTVTEKGYGIDRATRGPDWSHPAVSADRSSPNAPTGVLGLLVAAIDTRRRNGSTPLTILSCDNLPDNGGLLRDGVIGFAGEIDPDLARYIAGEVAFPVSMVDRITPAPTDRTLADAEQATGCRDLAAIETETFTQWVIEDRFPHGRPNWEAGGAIFVADVSPYERMKLTMLNGTHSMLAYAGYLSGLDYVRDVMADADLSALVHRHLRAAAAENAGLVDMDLIGYADDLAERFRNPEIAHATYQIAMDGTEKLPQRIFEPASSALAAGRPVAPFAFATAAWMRYALSVTDDNESYALRDPREHNIKERLAAVPREAAAIYGALAALPNFMPAPLHGAATWQDAVIGRLETMLRDGMKEAVACELSP